MLLLMEPVAAVSHPTPWLPPAGNTATVILVGDKCWLRTFTRCQKHQGLVSRMAQLGKCVRIHSQQNTEAGGHSPPVVQQTVGH